MPASFPIFLPGYQPGLNFKPRDNPKGFHPYYETRLEKVTSPIQKERITVKNQAGALWNRNGAWLCA